MQNTFNNFNNTLNNTLNNFPTSFEQYNANKPAGMSNRDWFFSVINPYSFPQWVLQLIYCIIRLCKVDDWSFAFMDSIAFMRAKSKRTIQRTLRKLVAIGLVEEKIEGNLRRYRMNKTNWDILQGKYAGNNIIQDFYNENITQDYYNDTTYDVTPDVTPSFSASSFESENYDTNDAPTLRDHINSSISLNHQKPQIDLSDPEILESDKKKDQILPPNDRPSDLIELDPIELEIKQEFEALTGKPLNIKKNRKPLTELKEIAQQAKDIVVLAFRNVAEHIAETGSKIYNLTYIVATAKNLMHPKTTPKIAPRDYSASSQQDKAYASIGGDPAKYAQRVPIETPEQKADRSIQENLAVRLALKHDALRTDLFNTLTDQDKNELIDMEVDYLKTKPIWHKLKPSWPWFDNTFALRYAIDKIKDYLLKDFLDNQLS